MQKNEWIGIGMSPGVAFGACAKGQVSALDDGVSVIWVVNAITVRDLARLDVGKVRGVVIETGSRVSHAIITAKSMRIPVLLLPDATRLLRSGDALRMDGATGELLRVNGSSRARAQDEPAERRLERVDAPIPLSDDSFLNLFASVTTPSEIAAAAAVGFQGVGMFRTECDFLLDVPPSEDMLFQRYTDACAQMQGRSIRFRLADLGGDRIPDYILLDAQANPLLGIRGMRMSMRFPGLLLTQLRALMRVAADYEVSVSVPMLNTVEEWRFVQQMLLRAAGQLDARGERRRDMLPMHLVIETPASALMFERIAHDAASVQIGLNDFMNYMMAADRNQPTQSALSHPYQPAIVFSVRSILRRAQLHHLSVMLCGEDVNDPNLLPLWIGLGVRRLAVTAPYACELARRAASLSVEACERAVSRALQALSYTEIANIMSGL